MKKGKIGRGEVSREGKKFVMRAKHGPASSRGPRNRSDQANKYFPSSLGRMRSDDGRGRNMLEGSMGGWGSEAKKVTKGAKSESVRKRSKGEFKEGKQRHKLMEI